MKEHKIYWDKTYVEDLGEQDADGFYEYAYCYFIYWFNMPDGKAILIRRYTDTPEECSFYGIYKREIQITDITAGKIIGKLDYATVHSYEYVGSIVDFLQKDGVTKPMYFDLTKGYSPFDLERLNRTEIKFERIEIIKKSDS